MLILGTSKQPFMCEKAKDYTAFKDFFCKVVFLPLPDYPSRQLLWTTALEKAGVERPNPDEVQTLARISECYSSGSICSVVKRTLTTRRVERLARKPFSIAELIGPLSKEVLPQLLTSDPGATWVLLSLYLPAHTRPLPALRTRSTTTSTRKCASGITRRST